jgi:outer membrane biosynthesis protein TonB
MLLRILHQPEREPEPQQEPQPQPQQKSMPAPEQEPEPEPVQEQEQVPVQASAREVEAQPPPLALSAITYLTHHAVQSIVERGIIVLLSVPHRIPHPRAEDQTQPSVCRVVLLHH